MSQRCDGDGPGLTRDTRIPLSCTRFQLIPTLGVQHSFQPNSDKTTLTELSFAARNKYWSGGPGVAGSSPVSPRFCQEWHECKNIATSRRAKPNPPSLLSWASAPMAQTPLPRQSRKSDHAVPVGAIGLIVGRRHRWPSQSGGSPPSGARPSRRDWRAPRLWWRPSAWRTSAQPAEESPGPRS